MISNNYINNELENEIKYLRERNAQLSSKINEFQSEIVALKAELSTSRKKPGRKKQNAEWQERYEQIKECFEKGMRPKDIMEKLYISSPTLYRYKKEYKKEKAKKNK